jgi:hypothetical protein
MGEVRGHTLGQARRGKKLDITAKTDKTVEVAGFAGVTNRGLKRKK